MLHFIIVLGSGRCVRCCFDGYVVVCVMPVAVLGGDVDDQAHNLINRVRGDPPNVGCRTCESKQVYIDER